MAGNQGWAELSSPVLLRLWKYPGNSCEGTICSYIYTLFGFKLIPSRNLEYELACLHLHSVWIALCFVDHLAICTFYLISLNKNWQQTKFTLNAIFIRVDRVSTRRRRSGTDLVNLKRTNSSTLSSVSLDLKWVGETGYCVTCLSSSSSSLFFISYTSTSSIITLTIHQQLPQKTQGPGHLQWAALWWSKEEIQRAPGLDLDSKSLKVLSMLLWLMKRSLTGLSNESMIDDVKSAGVKETFNSGMRSSGVGLLLPLELVRKMNMTAVLENITVHWLR